MCVGADETEWDGGSANLSAANWLKAKEMQWYGAMSNGI